MLFYFFYGFSISIAKLFIVWLGFVALRWVSDWLERL